MRLTITLLFFCGFYSLFASEKAEIERLHQRAYQLIHSDPDSAFSLGAIAEAKAARTGLALEEARSLYIQAYIYRQKEELGKAFILYLKALELLRPLEGNDARLTYTKILMNTGAILDYHHAYPQAVQYYDEGIELAGKYELGEILVILYNSKALSLRHNSQYNEALNILKKAIGLAEQYNDEKMMLSSLNQQGLTLKDMGRYDEARESYQKIIAFDFDQMLPEKYKGQAWHNIAVTYVEEEKYEKAVKAFRHALAEKTKGDSKRLYITYMDLGEVYYLIGDYKAAWEMEQKALSLYDEMLLLPDHYAIFNLLSKIAYALGEYDQAYTYSQRFESVNTRFLQAQKEILQVKDQYKMEILTAGFFLELEVAKTKEQYQNLMIILSLGFVFISVLFGYEKVKQKRVRRSIRNAILDIERESDM